MLFCCYFDEMNLNTVKNIDRSCKRNDKPFSSTNNKFDTKPTDHSQILKFSSLKQRSADSDLSRKPLLEINCERRSSGFRSRADKLQPATTSVSSALLKFNGTKVELLRQQSLKSSCHLRQSRSFKTRAAAKLPQLVTSDNSISVRTLFLDSQQRKLNLISLLPGIARFRMGQTLSEPITKKESSSDENHSLKVGASCMQGWRINMEDEHVHKLCLNDEKDTHFFAVFDGHGGQGAAQYAAKQLDTAVTTHIAYKRGDIITACKGGFLSLDDALSKESMKKEDSSGCTAVSVLIKGTKVYCANVGDSRAVASVRGHAQLLSFDHKPNHEREMKRIKAAGGFVEFNRVNGNLALSRALGDFNFKKNEQRSAEEQIVTADPDVIVKDLTSDHEFIVIACDGIWDVLSNQDVVEFVRDRLADKTEPDQICEELMDKCLATECAVGGVGCDNMTVIIIALKQNGSFDDVCKKCTVPKKDPIPPSCLLPSYPDYVRGGISCL